MTATNIPNNAYLVIGGEGNCYLAIGGRTSRGSGTENVVLPTGFVGHALLQDLHKRYGDAVALFSTSRKQKFTSKHWAWIKSDLTVPESLQAVLQETGAKTVFLSATCNFEAPKLEAFKINVEGTKIVLAECQKAGVTRFIFTSSETVIMKLGQHMDN